MASRRSSLKTGGHPKSGPKAGRATTRARQQRVRRGQPRSQYAREGLIGRGGRQRGLGSQPRGGRVLEGETGSRSLGRDTRLTSQPRVRTTASDAVGRVTDGGRV